MAKQISRKLQQKYRSEKCYRGGEWRSVVRYLIRRVGQERSVLMQYRGVMLPELLSGEVERQVVHQDMDRPPIHLRHLLQHLRVVVGGGIEQRAQKGVDLREVGCA